MVSEFMLQQTPVARVLPVYEQWLRALADARPTWPPSPTGEAVRAWGRLGYPRRALRLHAAATAIVERHGGEVPTSYDDLLALPGVGDYTAAAVASFAFGRRHAVLDTNVRRVLARAVGRRRVPAARGDPGRARRSPTALLPDDGPTAAAWAVAVMELGALVCTAATPALRGCPVADRCAWRRGRLPGVRRAAAARPDLRRHRPAVPRPAAGRAARRARPASPKAALDAAWPDAAQRERALAWLVADGLVVPLADGRFALP